MSNLNLKTTNISGDNQTLESNLKQFSTELIQFISALYPHKEYIALSEPVISEADKREVLSVLDRNMISSYGPEVTKFENQLSEFCGVNNTIALVNGTAALHLSLKALEIGKGDDVITQAYSYIAVPNAVRYVDAEPVFVDNNSFDLGPDSDSIEKTIAENYTATNKSLLNIKTGNRLKAIIAVYAFGQAYDIEAIKSICEKYDIYLIEDAAEALGTFVGNRHAGSFGDLGILSFNGNKICSSGSGGAILCNNSKLSEKIKHLSTTAKISDNWGTNYDDLGYNYRMANINAAMGLSQLSDIQQKLKAKLKLRNFYKNLLEKYGYRLIGDQNSNNWLNSFLVGSFKEKEIFLRMAKEKNIQLESSWVYIPGTDYYKDSQKYNILNAKSLSDKIIQLPGSLDFEI